MLDKVEIKKLSNDELKAQLKLAKISSGPITGTTRRIYENRLSAHFEILRKKQTKQEDGEGECNSNIQDEKKGEKSVDVKENGNKTSSNNEKVDKENETRKESSGFEKKPNNLILTVESVNENHFSAEKSSNQSSTNDNLPLPESCPSAQEGPVGDGYFYGLWVPWSPTRLKLTKPRVYYSQKSVLEALKKFPGSRFKQFNSKEEAEKFSTKDANNLTVVSVIDLIANTKITNNKDSKDVPKLEPLKAPTIQEVQIFRKYIEENDIFNVRKCLNNPKYLINSKDAPVIVHEGMRSNALHTAVKHDKLSICQVIMSHIIELETYTNLYPDIKDDESLKFRRDHVENLYLNTPEKIICDSPLHIACKLGFLEIVKFLLSFPATNINALNKDGKKASDVICTRYNVRQSEKEDRKNKIKALFEDKAYIPLYCGEDLPKVGQPIVTNIPSVSSILNQNKNIRACLGPCSPCQAQKIYHMWRKTPRDFRSVVRSDYDKGMERVGRSIAAQENLPYAEYWDFLECHIDLCTQSGLQKLENYLRQKAEKTKRCKTVAKVSKTRTLFNGDDTDGIKRKLSFENESESKVLAPRLSPVKKTSWSDVDCYCQCGELLENCEDCCVDIDIERLIVNFRMCCTIKDDSFNEGVDGGLPQNSFHNEFDSPESNIRIPEVYICGYVVFFILDFL
ncbi:ankyrin repeat and LEM domain-containing protein 2-like [Clytia hemisphaerica]|uniref:ankyrin repeat and LEM domain-containing protein 2-like n=1 Tax=Clytia hemisphaerica TaxID=252671 RepID=UPI0034D3930A